MSSKIRLQLGELHLVSRKRALKVDVEAFIDASGRARSDGQATDEHDPGIIQDATSLLSPSAWICRGRGLRLIIRPILWNQLRLSATRPTSESGYSRGDDIVIELRHTENSESNTKKRLHKLSLDVPHADVQPPNGIDTYGLECVHLKIFVNEWRPKRRGQPKAAKAERQRDFQTVHSAQSQLVEGNIDLLEWNAELGDNTHDTYFAENGSKIGHIPPHDVYADEMLLDDTPNSSLATTVSSEDADLLIETATAFPVLSDGVAESNLDLDAICELIDAALRLTMCERPNKLPQGVKVKQCSISPRLADLAPSLWSPGYLAATAQRSVFIPTISHALSHSLYKNARSSSLRQKLGALAESSGPAKFGPSPEAVQKAAAARMWQLMQHQVFDPKAARRLKPIQMRDQAFSDQLNDDLLINPDEGGMTLEDDIWNELVEDGGDDDLFDANEWDYGVGNGDDLFETMIWDYESGGAGFESELQEHRNEDAEDFLELMEE
ncbi:hypothetical protein NA57DRAFT_74266 [Rhizodiscina lignyota]|uniref:Uncharacterized protein n=1 Tax=Rhizodiscina lignyota TaxID=1504668 RepID=A0A9P4ILL1_9PEZI|nr:hypothetical protein NA57DRAFT_74266 [Rhizodiscina lignyota]